MAETQRSSTGPWVFAGFALLALVLALSLTALGDAIRDAAWVDACYSGPDTRDAAGDSTSQTLGFPECGDVRRQETFPR